LQNVTPLRIASLSWKRAASRKESLESDMQRVVSVTRAHYRPSRLQDNEHSPAPSISSNSNSVVPTGVKSRREIQVR
jgi:hypothetical protein